MYGYACKDLTASSFPGHLLGMFNLARVVGCTIVSPFP